MTRPHSQSPSSRLPWFRVFKHDGTQVDIEATFTQSSGFRMRQRMWELYNEADTKAVAVLSWDFTRVITSARKPTQ